MQLKIYSSFDEINSELEILKLEKELSYHRLALSFEKAKDNIQPQSIKNELVVLVKEKLSESFKSLLLQGIPFVLKYLKKEKRG